MERKYEGILTEAFLRQRYIVEQRNTYAIAQEVGATNGTIRNYLRAFHIPQRSHAEAVQTLIDYEGFSNLKDDWHAYWLGFLAADGCVFISEKKHSTWLNLVLKGEDIEHLYNFQQGVKTTAHIITGPNQNHKGTIAKLHIYNRHLVNALMGWGIVPQKTFSLCWPVNLPPELILAYIRGYFDGDGTVYIRRRSAPGTQWVEIVCRLISGSAPFLEALQGELNARDVVTRPIYRNQQSRAFVLPLSGKRENVRAFAALLYQGSSVCLERKRTIFQEAGIEA